MLYMIMWKLIVSLPDTACICKLSTPLLLIRTGREREEIKSESGPALNLLQPKNMYSWSHYKHTKTLLISTQKKASNSALEIISTSCHSSIKINNQSLPPSNDIQQLAIPLNCTTTLQRPLFNTPPFLLTSGNSI